jgi:lysophospholipid acyltransferase (LPLAT)-like uncharacterized protein
MSLRALRRIVIAVLVECVFRVLKATWRIEEAPLPERALAQHREGKTLVYAHWHQDEWAFLGAYAGREMAVLISESEDGSAMARVVTRLGIRVLRGSSSRGAVKGFLQLLRTVRREKIRAVSLAVDGPRGPRHEPKEGIIKLSEFFGGGLVVGAAFADRAWVFRKSWSQAFVPKPFARVVLSYAEVDGPLSKESVKKALLFAKELARKNVEAWRQ